MARRTPPRKVTYFEPVPPRLARNTIIESTFEVGRRFSCTMRVDWDPGTDGSQTLPWREVDSNHRYPSRDCRRSERFAQRS
jgi:hypothetical protein